MSRLSKLSDPNGLGFANFHGGESVNNAASTRLVGNLAAKEHIASTRMASLLLLKVTQESLLLQKRKRTSKVLEECFTRWVIIELGAIE